jgi:cyclic pyranopterin phosphate synthase
MSPALRDKYSRPMRDLRISVTDRCNYRCAYCMPLDEYEWIDRQEILTFEEIERLARIFIALGIEKIRLTGGEPLLRRDLARLVANLAPLEGLLDLCLTTNGSLLAENAEALRAAGLMRINVSLDTLDPQKFKRISKRGDLSKVLDGLFRAQSLGFDPIKINAVIERGVNDDEVLDLVEFGRINRFAVRFIEYMDVGNSNHWHSSKMVPKQEIIGVINSRFPLVERGREHGSAPSLDYLFADGIRAAGVDVGVIASVTEPFCGSCTRVRLTADGKLVTCLFSNSGFDLKALLRGGASDKEITAAVESVWRARTDRYSDERLEALESAKGYDPEAHRKIEMISLGG